MNLLIEKERTTLRGAYLVLSSLHNTMPLSRSVVFRGHKNEFLFFDILKTYRHPLYMFYLRKVVPIVSLNIYACGNVCLT